MTLFDELVMDALRGSAGRFVPGMPLEKLRQERRIMGEWAQVPVPRSEPSSPKVHVAQVATRVTSEDKSKAYIQAAITR